MLFISPILVTALYWSCLATAQPPYSNFVAAVPNGLYPAPPPGQFQYLYTPITTTTTTNGQRDSNSSTRRNQKVNSSSSRRERNKNKKNRRVNNMKAVNYTYIPIELLSTLLTPPNTRPVEPMPIVNLSDQDVQLGSGVYIRVPLRFRNSTNVPQAEVSSNEDSQDDEQLEAIADNEVIPMEMFEEMLEMDMRRRFNTSSPVFNSAEGVRVTLNNLLRLFAPPASLLRRAGTNTHQQENLFMRLLRDRYQLSSGIFNANNNNNNI